MYWEYVRFDFCQNRVASDNAKRKRLGMSRSDSYKWIRSGDGCPDTIQWTIFMLMTCRSSALCWRRRALTLRDVIVTRSLGWAIASMAAGKFSAHQNHWKTTSEMFRIRSRPFTDSAHLSLKDTATRAVIYAQQSTGGIHLDCVGRQFYGSSRSSPSPGSMLAVYDLLWRWIVLGAPCFDNECRYGNTRHYKYLKSHRQYNDARWTIIQ